MLSFGWGCTRSRFQTWSTWCFTPLAVQVPHSHHRFIYKDPAKEAEKCVKPLISETENHSCGISIGLQDSSKWDLSLLSSKSISQKTIPFKKINNTAFCQCSFSKGLNKQTVLATPTLCHHPEILKERGFFSPYKPLDISPSLCRACLSTICSSRKTYGQTSY